MNVYDFKVKKMDGSEVSLRDYEGKVLLIVNTASKCRLYPAVCRTGSALPEL